MSTSVIAPPKRPEIKTALPGPKGQKIVEADAKFVNPSYPRPSFKLVAERAKGVWVEDVDGNIFLDCNAGVAVCSTGHCHPEVVRAIQDQAAELIHMCGTDYYYRHMPQLGGEARSDCSDQGAYTNSLRKQRHRSSRNCAQACDARHWPRKVHRVLQQLPRPHFGFACL